MHALISGQILLWFGAIVDIPNGFVICDGTNGTPDLRNKFVVGAGGSFAVDETGGSDNHDHTFIADPHSHTIPAGAGLGPGASFADQTDPASAQGSTDTVDNIPPFHSLAYIMKV